MPCSARSTSGATEPGRIVALLVLVAVLSGALQFIYGLALVVSIRF